jgi:hypothetical protein
MLEHRLMVYPHTKNEEPVSGAIPDRDDFRYVGDDVRVLER